MIEYEAGEVSEDAIDEPGPAIAAKRPAEFDGRVDCGVWWSAGKEELAGTESQNLPEFWFSIFAGSGKAAGDECIESAKASGDA